MAKSPRSARRNSRQLFDENLLFLWGSRNISDVQVKYIPSEHLRSIVDGRNEMWLPFCKLYRWRHIQTRLGRLGKMLTVLTVISNACHVRNPCCYVLNPVHKRVTILQRANKQTNSDDQNEISSSTPQQIWARKLRKEVLRIWWSGSGCLFHFCPLSTL